jgi:SNF2 family DNA or RNA helicase
MNVIVDYLENFTKICNKKIYLHKNINDEDIICFYGEYCKLFILDRNDISNETYRLPGIRILNDIDKTIHQDNIIRFHFMNSEYIVYPYLNWKTEDEMRNETIKDIMKYNYFLSNYSKSTIITKLEKENGEYYITHYINNKIINNIISGKREYKRYILLELLSSTYKNIIHDDILSSLSSILNNHNHNDNHNISNTIDSNTILKENINLYNYQINDIKWMSNIENAIVNSMNDIYYEFDTTIHTLENKYILYNNNLLPNTYNFDNIKQRIVKYQGGNLISDIGLGKTIISLYHIFNEYNKDNQRYNLYSQFIEYSEQCNYIFKRGKQKGIQCTKSKKENEVLYCLEHAKMSFNEKRVLLYKNLDYFRIDDYIHKNSIKSNATLIICPNQLCDQWVNEYYNKFVNNKNVVLIVTKDQYNNITFGDLLFADIIIISYNFLTNPFYISEFNKHYYNIQNIIHKIHNTTKNNESVLELLNSKCYNLLHLFTWRRIYLDEAHEIQNMSTRTHIVQLIHNLKSNFIWNITGTPFANGINSFLHLISYNTNLRLNTHDINKTSIFTLLNNGINKNMIDNLKYLFRRNTKESIQNEYKGNIINENLNLLEFTKEERSIYDSYLQAYNQKNYDFLIKLCCHSELYSDTKHLIKNCKTLNEIQHVMLDYNKQKLDILKKSIHTSETNISFIQSEIDKCENENDIELLKAQLTIYKRKYTNDKNMYTNIEKTYTYLYNTINSMDIDDTCPICLDVIEKDTLAITKCGHKFCWECICETYNMRVNAITESNLQFKCPTCNTFMNNNDIYLLTDKTNSCNYTELSNIVNSVKSTKIGNIIYFIKTQLKEDDKLILFSQWDEILHKVGNLLKEHNINIVYCNGTIYQRKKAINNFCKNKDINVILLSSRNAASGINLTEANKIILLEPVYGTQEYRYDIESQAIGRSNRIGQKRPIDVYRFIIKDTIENDIINNKIDENYTKQLTL